MNNYCSNLIELNRFFHYRYFHIRHVVNSLKQKAVLDRVANRAIMDVTMYYFLLFDFSSNTSFLVV